MKHFIAALCILAVIITACAVSMSSLHRTCGDVMALLDQAELAADRREHERAATHFASAMKRWDDKEWLFAILLRHSERDAVTLQLAAAHEYLRSGELTEYRAANAEVVTQLEHIQKMENLNWNNLL